MHVVEEDTKLSRKITFVFSPPLYFYCLFSSTTSAFLLSLPLYFYYFYYFYLCISATFIFLLPLNFYHFHLYISAASTFTLSLPLNFLYFCASTVSVFLPSLHFCYLCAFAVSVLLLPLWICYLKNSIFPSVTLSYSYATHSIIQRFETTKTKFQLGNLFY